MSCGIYKYENKINHNIYIGQSKNIEARIRGHRSSSYNINDKDYNMVIHKPIRKYGEDNFDITIIERCQPQLLNEREQFWINYYNSYHNGYNATPGGDNANIAHEVAINLYDYDGNYITSYESVTKAAQDLHISRNTIYSILYGQRLSTCGFQIKRVDDDTPITKYKNRQGGKIAIIQLDKNNNFIHMWDSAAQAGRELSLDASAITKCTKGKLKTCGGYRWITYDKYKE